MIRITSMSPYRMGPPRFGSRHQEFDNSVKIYKLSPEELEKYFSSNDKSIPLKSTGQKGDEQMSDERKSSVVSIKKYEEILNKYEKLNDELEKLKVKVAEKENLVAEQDEKLKQVSKQLEATISDKNMLINENNRLQNEVNDYKDVIKQSQERCDFYEKAYKEFEQELQALRSLVFINLQRTVSESAS